MAEVTLTDSAREDLLDIWHHIARDSVRAADNVIDQIEARCRELATAPMSGRLRDEFRPDLRSIPVGRFLVFYLPDPGGITVARVVRGERDLPSVWGA